MKGLRGPFSCLNNARYGISWGALGAAMACFHSAKTYAPLASNSDNPSRRTSWCRTNWHGCSVKSPKGNCSPTTLVAKRTTAVVQRADQPREDEQRGHRAGNASRRSRHPRANGVLDEYPVMRHMANLESVKTYEGTHDIHNLILGRYITGIQAFTRQA